MNEMLEHRRKFALLHARVLQRDDMEDRLKDMLDACAEPL